MLHCLVLLQKQQDSGYKSSMGKHSPKVPFREVLSQLKTQKEEQVQQMANTNSTNGVSAVVAAEAAAQVPSVVQVNAADFAKLLQKLEAQGAQIEHLTKLAHAVPVPVAAPAPVAVPAAPAAPAAPLDPTTFATTIATAVATALKETNEPKKKSQSLADGLGTVLHGESQTAVAKAAQAVVENNTDDEVKRLTKVIADYGATAKLLCEVEEAQNKAVRNAWPWFLRGLVPVL